ncbi:zonadhesin-like isoform X2 [Anticarsia gemmatalis]|uniref:zonadhesin-like isoform X2 n=1 Tax=Anticarsia gemmatalis TaxID=129554 RepID=UPI003F7754B8
MLVIYLFLLTFSDGVFCKRPPACGCEEEGCNGDRNAVPKSCPNPCPSTCAKQEPVPCPATCPEFGCECKTGYILNEVGGKCVPRKSCPKEPLNPCGENERYAEGDVNCVRTCGNRLLPWETMGACAPYTGCICQSGYYRKYDNSTGPCIPEEECPPLPESCGINEVRSSCRIVCPPQSCESIYTLYSCLYSDCEPGCNCRDGYLRDFDGECIPSEECPPPKPIGCNGDPNASPNPCPRICPATCAQPDGDISCGEGCGDSGCECNPGYVLDVVGGTCVTFEECPGNQGCNGDPNAEPKDCPTNCPATCAQPDVRNIGCNKMCNLNRCVCKDGYILSKKGGRCIEPDECPGGSPTCPANRTYVDCAIDCPESYCPVDDSLDEILCDPPYSCAGGCSCIEGYLLLSYEDPKCVLSSECPPVPCTRPNEVWDPAPSTNYRERCEDIGSDCDGSTTGPPRCVCEPGYYRNQSDICVPASECNIGCNGDPNAVFNDCPSSCPPTCAQPDTSNINCIQLCDPSKCVCKDGYILTKKGGKCVKRDECPEIGCNGDPNAVANDCPSSCPATCAQQDTSDIFCIDLCDPSGCECKPGYILDDYGGKCILPSECPNVGCKGDPNAEPNECPSACPPTCALADTSGTICTFNCDPSGCVCKEGYILSEKRGRCIDPYDCPGGSPICPANKTFVFCSVNCPSSYCPVDDSRDIFACDPPYPCPSRCSCSEGYLIASYDDPRCILSSECPPVTCTRPNEIWDPAPLYCNTERCEDINTECFDSSTGPPRCVCEPGYYRNQSDICVPASECVVGCNGDPNAEPNECPSACPPTCALADTSGIPCTANCDLSRCVCKQGYILSREGGKCVDPYECPGGAPTCPANQTYVDCLVGCQKNYCPISDSLIIIDCALPYPCPSGCTCKDGYLLLSYEDPRCVLSSECPPVDCTKPNEVWDPAPLNCRAERCEDIDIVCFDDSTGPPRCVCEAGYYRNQSNICVPAFECDAGCNGDPNAIPYECPSACPPTCALADTSGTICTANCDPSGCVCKPGYILSKKPGGQCIDPYSCPGGSPKCPANKTYVSCFVGCPSDYCPTDDSLAIYACDPPYPCSGGCNCKEDYLMLSYDDPRCIRSSECPPVTCTRPNEIWDPAPPNCNPERCEDIYSECFDSSTGPPRCVCEPGYYRNQSDICVPASECNNVGCDGDINASRNPCATYCPATCAQLDASGIICIDACNVDACECNAGYVLSEPGGKCIRIEDCPDNVQCNGDVNATRVTCPSACPATCDDANTRGFCPEVCLESGCQCKTGYILNEIGGQCIQPGDCPGGVPVCGENKTFVDCFVGCPPSYCPIDDSRGIIACSIAFPCPPGCACAGPDYLMLSYEDPRCILSLECPPVTCTRPNEVWDPNPKVCYFETCDDIGKDCSIDYLNNSPRCVCKPGFYRNQSDICVPASECGCGGDPNAVESSCTSFCPATCDDPDPTCIQACDSAGCVCKPGYILTEKGGRCVKPEECPNYQQCNGDLNATRKSCPNPCPPTCDNAEGSKPCTKACLVSGCECKTGYILNKLGGQCVLPENCPGGFPTCGENKTYVECFVGCPPSYCPNEYNTGFVDCVVAYPCNPGCACARSDYLMISYEDPRCVLASDCPPVTCSNPNEVWNPNPPSCPSESCDDIGRECNDDFAISLSFPRCVCKPGYYRNQLGVCVPASECGCNGDPNARRNVNDCPSACQPTCADPDTSQAPCPAVCDESGCECKPGFIRESSGGKCIEPDQCPGGSPSCGANKTYVPCQFGCPTNYCPQSDTRAIVACSPPFFCQPGCACKPGYLIASYDDPRCVLSSECPPVECTRPNEVWEPSPSNCYSERCEDIYVVCDYAYPSPPRCVCEPDYYRNQSDICIPASECPQPLNCGANETEVACRTICPPQNCEIAYTDYACDKYQGICERGCDCLPDYLRNGSGVCVFNNDCPYPSTPICGINEIARDCRRICPPQTCESRYALYKCASNIRCEPGCDCVANYLRNSRGECVPADKCDSNEPQICSVPNQCIRTCATPNPPNCPYKPAESNIDGCECMEGYILSEVGGKCIRIEECPNGCNGDPNAKAMRCPLACPSTCASPNADPSCKKLCEPIACQCTGGYLLSNDIGTCILPDKCPGGNPCRKNEEFRECKYNCPEDYCPVDDGPQPVCDPLPFCVSGCTCKQNNRRLSYEDDRCIEASECPPVKCTRQNEVWDPCPNVCFSGYCADKEYQDVPCNTLLPDCRPQCVCERDTFRNYSGICVPASECPPTCPVSSDCFRTCASPNPPYCPYEPSETNEDGCQCMEGYILSEVGGKCIRIGECPDNSGCDGDPNARAKRCPAPCPSTCGSPDAIPCKMKCDDIGCECKPGFMRFNLTGPCVTPDECPGGNPCGPNGRFVECKNDCTSDYCPVDDSRDPAVCSSSSDCLSGCICRPNNKKLSREDRRCITSSDCPPVKCTRPNEVWSKCPSACLAEKCEDAGKKPPRCQTLLLNCEPRCICKKNHYRNDDDICVPADECGC